MSRKKPRHDRVATCRRAAAACSPTATCAARWTMNSVDLRGHTGDALMTANPRTITADKLAVEAAQMMEAHKIHALLVVDEHRRAGRRTEHPRPAARAGHLMAAIPRGPARRCARDPRDRLRHRRRADRRSPVVRQRRRRGQGLPRARRARPEAAAAGRHRHPGDQRARQRGRRAAIARTGRGACASRGAREAPGVRCGARQPRYCPQRSGLHGRRPAGPRGARARAAGGDGSRGGAGSAQALPLDRLPSGGWRCGARAGRNSSCRPRASWTRW
jgi:CBS domain-containing protein